MEGPFSNLVPENEGWLVVFFPGGALCVTGEDETAETKTAVRLAFEAFARLKPWIKISHLVLVLHMRQRRCCGLGVSMEGPPPAVSREQIADVFGKAGHLCLAVSIAGDFRFAVRGPASAESAHRIMSLVRAVGGSVTLIDSMDTIRLADARGKDETV